MKEKKEEAKKKRWKKLIRNVEKQSLNLSVTRRSEKEQMKKETDANWG